VFLIPGAFFDWRASYVESILQVKHKVYIETFRQITLFPPDTGKIETPEDRTITYKIFLFFMLEKRPFGRLEGTESNSFESSELTGKKELTL
jgi:hypothetical protein